MSVSSTGTAGSIARKYSPKEYYQTVRIAPGDHWSYSVFLWLSAWMLHTRLLSVFLRLLVACVMVMCGVLLLVRLCLRRTLVLCYGWLFFLRQWFTLTRGVGDGSGLSVNALPFGLPIEEPYLRSILF